MAEKELVENLKPLVVMMLSTFAVCLSATFSQVIAVDLVLDLSPRSLSDFQWMFPTSLMGCCAGMSLCAGTIDRYGRRAPYLAGSVLFVIGTAVIAVAGSMDVFNMARVVQGLGCGAVIVTCIAQVRFTLPSPNLRYTAQGILSLGFGLGMLFGIFMGQYAQNIIGWRDYMWVLMVCQIALTYPCMLALGRGERGTGKADIPGAVTLAFASAIFIYMLQKLYMTKFVMDAVNISVIASFIMFISLFVYFEYSNPDSMAYRKLDDGKLMLASLIMIILLGAIDMAAVGWMVKVTLFTFQLDVLSAWPCFIWVVIGAAVTAITASKLIEKTGHMFWFVAACLLSPIALTSAWSISVESTTFQLCLHLFMLGLAIGCLVSLLNATIQNRTDSDSNGGYTSFAVMIRTAALWGGFNLYQVIADSIISRELGPTVDYWNAVLGLDLPSNSQMANLLMTPAASAVKVVPGLVETIGSTYIRGVAAGYLIMGTVFAIIGIITSFMLARGRRLV